MLNAVSNMAECIQDESSDLSDMVDDDVTEDNQDFDDTEIDFFFSKYDNLEPSTTGEDANNKSIEIIDLSDDGGPKKAEKPTEESKTNAIISDKAKDVKNPSEKPVQSEHLKGKQIKKPLSLLTVKQAQTQQKVQRLKTEQFINKAMVKLLTKRTYRENASAVSEPVWVETFKNGITVVTDTIQPKTSGELKTCKLDDVTVKAKGYNQRSLLKRSVRSDTSVSKDIVVAKKKLLAELLNKEQSSFDSGLKNGIIKSKIEPLNADIAKSSIERDIDGKTKLQMENDKKSVSYITINKGVIVKKKINEVDKSKDEGKPNELIHSDTLKTNNDSEIHKDKIHRADEKCKNGYMVADIGGFKVVHDADGAIIKMEEKMDDDVEMKVSEDISVAEDMETEKLCSLLEKPNGIDVKLLMDTKVGLENCSDFLNNSHRYCNQCQTLFPTVQTLDHHRSQIHPLLVPDYDQDLFYCQLCDKSQASKRDLERHLHIHTKASTLASTKKNTEYCFICRIMFSCKSSLYYHVNKAHVVNLQCRDCGAEFPLKELLDDHSRTLHQAKRQIRIKCSVCPRSFCSRNVFKAHNKVKHKGLAKAVRVKLNYKRRHNLLTQKTAIFECSKCNTNFTSHFRAREHYSSCKGVAKRWCCQECQKYFIIHDNHLMQHRVASDIKSYSIGSTMLNVLSKCPKCKVHFKEKYFIKKHNSRCAGTSKSFYCCGLYLPVFNLEEHSKEHAYPGYIVLEY